MGIRKLILKAGEKASDGIAKLAVLSPEQLYQVAKARDEYLSAMPDPNDFTAEELTGRLMAASGVEIFNAYLPQIQDIYWPVDRKAEYSKGFDSFHNIRYINITKWVTDKKENSLEKLVNVYEVLSNEECNIALVFNRTTQKTNVYLAVTNTQNSQGNVEVDSLRDRLKDALRGNFPGSEWSNEGAGIIPCLEKDKDYSVAIASNIPTEKSEKFVSQTIEKLLDGIIPAKPEKEYTIILLATPVQTVEERKLRLAELYSSLSSYAGWETNYTFTQSDSATSMATFGINAGVNAGVQSGQNQTITDTQGSTQNEQDTVTDSTNDSVQKTENESLGNTTTEGETDTETYGVNYNETHGESSNTSHTVTEGVYGSVSASASAGTSIFGVDTNVTAGVTAGGHLDVSDASGYTISDSVSSGTSKAVAKAVAKSVSETATKTIGKAITNSTGRAVSRTIGKALSNSIARAAGTSRGVNFGGNFGANFARSSNVTATVGSNEGITQHFKNYTIQHTLEILEKQMKRYETSTALGMWDFAAYVLSEDMNVANNVAHTYLALTQGEESYMVKTAVNLWRGDLAKDNSESNKAAKEIYGYLKELRHPIFGLNEQLIKDIPQFSVYPAVVNATTTLSGKELAYSLNFPQKSVAGLPVIECAEFGRNISSFDELDDGTKFELGSIFHMHHAENTKAYISKNSLASHTFVTGSTGSGKSNTIYKILDEAYNHNVKYLVIEPTKGEYKNIFGEFADVYGTNPSMTPLLRINPFSFPKEIHVLEHLDRLIEIFNVCWPMYAAMPAVLKNAVEKSYEDCGWNLIDSTNEFGEDLYPRFSDVARNVKTIIDSSEYDNENKGAYKGSLLTRLQSLSNGINGLIFTTDEISSKDLFDKNVIIDISRVGSTETKSLIMGMLVLKLQEYRIATTEEFNMPLKHLTVLEEAHNLLKRTSSDFSMESGNLAGKSVEMLANAIAEMRTYGEGFIIADQAPGLLDMSVIRNTNTKIIMRLPDESDRQLVGKAANLNEEQIVELAKLPRGVAAVYQNEWIQPILCLVKKADFKSVRYYFNPEKNTKEEVAYNERLKIVDLLCKGTAVEKEVILKEIKPVLSKLGVPSSVKASAYHMLEKPYKEPRMTKIAPVIAAVFPELLEKVEAEINTSKNEKLWTDAANNELLSYKLELDEQTRRDIVQGIITYYFIYKNNDINRLRDWSINGGLI